MRHFFYAARIVGAMLVFTRAAERVPQLTRKAKYMLNRARRRNTPMATQRFNLSQDELNILAHALFGRFINGQFAELHERMSLLPQMMVPYLVLKLSSLIINANIDPERKRQAAQHFTKAMLTYATEVDASKASPLFQSWMHDAFQAWEDIQENSH